jgi:hypothetical protein
MYDILKIKIPITVKEKLWPASQMRPELGKVNLVSVKTLESYGKCLGPKY